MKQFFNNRSSTNLPPDTEVLNLLFSEIKNTQNFFPSEKLKTSLERFVKIDLFIDANIKVRAL